MESNTSEAQIFDVGSLQAKFGELRDRLEIILVMMILAKRHG